MKLPPQLASIHLPLKAKITLCFCGLIALTLGSFWMLSRAELQRTLQQQADALGSTFATQTADSVRELVLANDLLSLNVILDQVTGNTNIAEVSVYDIDGQLLAASRSKANVGASSTAGTQINSGPTYQAQITLQDSIAGSVLLQLDTSALITGFEQAQMFFWIILGLGLGLTLTTAFLLAANITTPILAIVDAIQEPDDYSIQVDPERNDEIALLESTCAELLGKIELEKEQQKLSEQEELEDTDNTESYHNKPAKIMASVLIVKVVSINTAIELLHPSTLSRLLNEYLFYLKQAAKLYDGKIYQFAGESVMVAFDSRQSSDSYSFKAVCCAQLFLELMNRVATQHRAEASQALEFRLAIHSGETFITVANNAQQEVQNQALVGKVIETSYFLCKHSKPGQLIISETTYSQAEGEATLAADDSIEITMPSDNMSFMAYILNTDRSEHFELLETQCQQILPES